MSIANRTASSREPFTPKLTTFLEEKRSPMALARRFVHMSIASCGRWNPLAVILLLGIRRSLLAWSSRFSCCAIACASISFDRSLSQVKVNAPALYSEAGQRTKGIVNQLDLHKKKIIYLLNHMSILRSGASSVRWAGYSRRALTRRFFFEPSDFDHSHRPLRSTAHFESIWKILFSNRQMIVSNDLKILKQNLRLVAAVLWHREIKKRSSDSSRAIPTSGRASTSIGYCWILLDTVEVSDTAGPSDIAEHWTSLEHLGVFIY